MEEACHICAAQVKLLLGFGLRDLIIVPNSDCEKKYSRVLASHIDKTELITTVTSAVAVLVAGCRQRAFCDGPGGLGESSSRRGGGRG